MEEIYDSCIVPHLKRKYKMGVCKKFWFTFTKKNKQNKICLIKKKKLALNQLIKPLKVISVKNIGINST